MLLAALPLAGCEATNGATDGRPQAKPGELTAVVITPGGQRQPAKVETAKGQILLTSLEGTVVPVPLDSADGRRAMGAAEAEMTAAQDAGAPDKAPDVGAPDPGAPDPGAQNADGSEVSARDSLVAEFEAHSAPVLPDAPEGAAKPDPKDFLGATVREIAGAPTLTGARRSQKPDGGTLVEVRAQTRRGVDADTAFAYATCALAGWASREGVPYARHIRTLQTRGNDRQRLDAVFMISDTEPMGLRIVEATRTLGDCSARGIPAS